MYPLDDNNLDRLSREAAEHFEVEAGASGWDHLEQRLDKELPQEKKRRRFLFWLFFITAVTGGALTAILKYHQPAPPLANNVSGVVTPANQTAPLPNNDQTGDSHLNNTTQQQPTSGNNQTPEAAAKQQAAKQPVTNDQQANTITTDTKAGSASTTINSNHQQATVANPVNTPNKPSAQPVEKTRASSLSRSKGVHIQKTPAGLNYATMAPVGGAHRPFKKTGKQKPGKHAGITGNQNNQATLPATDNVTDNNTAEPDNRITNNDAAITNKPADANKEAATAQPNIVTQADSLKNKTAATQAVDSTKTIAKQKKKDNKIKQPLEFGVMVGPDMSAVAFGPLYKAGYNFGVQIGYRFSNRWSVNVGAIYTKKFYKTDSTHFNYKENPWPNTTLSRVEGNCSMWEFPVNVRYDFSFNNKRRWFASTGLSTYLMNKEDYDVYYRWNGGPAYPVPLNSDTNSSYPFSIWNLSVGMERSLGQRFSLQAEPYLKVPLTGLGKGNMRMDSYGILFTLKYKPFLKSKKDQTKK